MYTIIMHTILHLHVLLSIIDGIIQYNYIMEYANDIYPCTCIRIMTFYITRIMSYIYTCLLELRIIPAAYCKSIPCFSNKFVFLYNFV